MSEYYDKKGNEITLHKWTQLFEDINYRRIAQDQIDGTTISTVWLGIDHGISGCGPLIFETMIFRDNGDELCYRWYTEEEARGGHATLTAEIIGEGPSPQELLEVQNSLVTIEQELSET